ncbi:MAG TPA: bifunctional 4-hydroxy-2-oxoglutarate aldolase/2-dehydro-3-deoxy-phosphogluconate aldolase [Haliangiales bacterium]|nr:bifunctional 4-hydroxy-2-oxoglutarate aldolase/2-dehydro-3-deoxy-phosphogluconate aldolase [Haliangiales bacterium]
MSFADLLAAERVLAIIRARDARTAADAMDAAVRGGFRVLEFTLDTPGALELVETFARRDGLTVGAGTVLLPDDVDAAVRRGARFLVSPVVDEAVATAAARAGIPLVPGTATPTEMFRAHAAGAEVVKLFPAPAGGPAWVRAILGPLPFLRIVPTQGVDADNAAAWLEAGCLAVGSGAFLFPRELLAARAWDEVEARARALLAAVGRRASV